MKDVNLSFKVSKGVTDPFPLAGSVLLPQSTLVYSFLQFVRDLVLPTASLNCKVINYVYAQTNADASLD